MTVATPPYFKTTCVTLRSSSSRHASFRLMEWNRTATVVGKKKFSLCPNLPPPPPPPDDPWGTNSKSSLLLAAVDVLSLHLKNEVKVTAGLQMGLLSSVAPVLAVVVVGPVLLLLDGVQRGDPHPGATEEVAQSAQLKESRGSQL